MHERAYRRSAGNKVGGWGNGMEKGRRERSARGVGGKKAKSGEIGVGRKHRDQRRTRPRRVGSRCACHAGRSRRNGYGTRRKACSSRERDTGHNVRTCQHAAKHARERKRRTDEDVPNACLARLLVGEPALVLLEAREADRHLRHNTRQDRTKTLVEREWGLSPHDQCPSCNEPTWFCLGGCRPC